MVFNYCTAMLRSAGDTFRPMVFLTAGGICNLILDFVVIVGMGMGVFGAGLTTAISNWIAAALILIYLMRTNGALKVRIREIKIHLDKLRQILVIGIPAGLQSCVFSLSNVVVQLSINGFGEIAMAGSTAANQIGNVIYTAMHAVYQAIMNFVAQNVGAGRWDRVKKIILDCSLLVFLIGIAVSAVTVIFGRSLLAIYAPGNAAVMEAGMIRIYYVCGTYFLCGLMEVGCGAMRGMGSSLVPMLCSVVGTCVVRVGWVYTVFALYPTLSVLYLSFPVSWLFTAVCHYLCAFFYYLRLKRKSAISSEISPSEAKSAQAVY